MRFVFAFDSLFIEEALPHGVSEMSKNARVSDLFAGWVFTSF
jgi:hypothetical protein